MSAVVRNLYRLGSRRFCQRKGFVLPLLLGLLLLPLSISPVSAQQEEKNASHKAFQTNGGNALKQDAIAPGPETFDETLQPGSDTGKPKPASGTVDPLGPQTAATIGSLGVPGAAPPFPPQVEIPVICETCGLSRKYTAFK